MWLDNASEIDILFYSPYAATIASTMCEKENTPLTIGLFGKWGAGKSTLVNLIKQKLQNKEDDCIVVDINAWLFEGYTDAKTSLMEVIATELEKKENISERITDKCKKLWTRINKIKLGKSLLSLGGNLITTYLAPNTLSLAGVAQAAKGAAEAISGDEIKDETTVSISEFREEFAALIEALDGRTVIFIIDDLDRCSPERIIDTLEAIKLFLSVPGTVFLIAADNEVIEYSISNKYPGLMGRDNKYAREYIEKIIQLPIVIPTLSEKDVMNYLMLLMVQKHIKNGHFKKYLEQVQSQNLHTRDTFMTYSEICALLDDLADMPYKSLEHGAERAKEDLKVIDGIRETIAKSLNGNPRQAKRFLNSFVMKRQLAELYYPGEIDAAVLAKVMALYQISPDAFKELYKWNCQFDGTIPNLREALDITTAESINAESIWKTDEIQKWSRCPPIDIESYPLDHYFYLTRENLQSDDIRSDLSLEAKNVLATLKKATGGTIDKAYDDLNKLGESQTSNVISLFIRGMKGTPSEWLFAVRLLKGYEQRVPSLLDKVATLQFGMEALPFLKELKSLYSQQFDKLYKSVAEDQKKVLEIARGKGKKESGHI